MTLANMAEWAKIKGIDLLSSADFTHPAWIAELEKTWPRMMTAILSLAALSLSWGLR
jgi:PHP family Zn ribbon phosphoesterase